MLDSAGNTLWQSGNTGADGIGDIAGHYFVDLTLPAAGTACPDLPVP